MKLNIGDIVFFPYWNEYATVLDKGRERIKINHAGLIVNYHYCYLEDFGLEIQSQTKILCKHSDFLRLKKMHGIGIFYHDLSPLYEKLCIKPTKFVTFRDNDTKETISLHLGKATKIIKKVKNAKLKGYKYRVGDSIPLVKLQFIGEL